MPPIYMLGGGFVERLLRANARVLAREFRKAADLLEVAAPGPPVLAIPVLFHHQEEIAMGEITVPDDAAPLNATVKFLDAEGHEATPDDTPQWSSTDDSVASVTASDDGMSAEIEVGGPGAAVIEVKTVEANTGAEVVAQGTVTVQPGDVTVGSVEFEGGSSPESV